MIALVDVSNRQVSVSAPGQPSSKPLPRLSEPLRVGHQALLRRLQRLQGRLLHRWRRGLPHICGSELKHFSFPQNKTLIQKIRKSVRKNGQL
jgi:hypothetical protein